MKRNNLLKTISALLLLGVISVITACSHEIESKSSSEATVTQLLPVINSSQRTVFPDFNVNDLYGIKLEAKENGSAEDFKQIAIWDNVDTISAIDFKPGTYSLRLTAYQGEVTFVATKSRITIEKGKVTPVNFVLKIDEWGITTSDGVKSKGNIDITVRWDAGVNAISNKVTLYTVDTDGEENAKFTDSNVKVYYDNESKNGGWYINYSKYDLPYGEYKFDFVVTDENYKQGFYTDYIVVAADCTSSNTYVIENWSDMYAVASVAYSKQSKHVTAEPEEGKGIKITLNYKEDDPAYWTDIRVKETVSGIYKSISIWNVEDQKTENMLGKDGKQSISFVYPFVEDNGNYIFEIQMWGGDEPKTYADYVIENVVVQANGGNSDILDADYKSKIQKAGIKTGEVGASFKYKTDITKLFTDYKSLKKLVLDYRFHSGDKSKEGRDWNGCYQNFWCDLQDQVGYAEYRTLVDADSDGIFVNTSEALDVLKEESNYFVTTYLYFKADNESGEYCIAFESEETPYTIAKMNTITYVIDADTTESYLYPANTKVTFTNPTRKGFICEGLYKEADFSGSPIKGLSKAENTEDLTLYPKWSIIFSQLDGAYHVKKINMMIHDLDANYDKTLKVGDSVAFAFSGKANMDFEAPLYFQIYDCETAASYNRGECIVTPRFKAGEEFTINFGIDVIKGNGTDTVDIPPERLIIQMEYQVKDFDKQIIVSDYTMTFEDNPIEYTYVVTKAKENGAYSNTEKGYFINNIVKTLPTPTYDCMSFAGWYDNPEYSGSPITKVSATDNTAKTFYAKWNIAFDGQTTDEEYTTHLTITDFQEDFDFDFEIEAWNGKNFMMIVNGTSNVDLSGSIGTYFQDTTQNCGIWMLDDKIKKGEITHTKIDDIKAGIPFSIQIPIGTYSDEDKTVKGKNLITYLGYWVSDCSEKMIISDWSVEIKPATQIRYKLDNDCWLYENYEWKSGNPDALIEKYAATDSVKPVTLLTEASREGYSRKLEGWYKDGNLTDGPYTEYIPSKDVELYAKWSLVFEEGSYINGGDNLRHYNYGTALSFNSFSNYQDREKNSNGDQYGPKPNLKKGDHVTVVLKATPTANTDIGGYTIGGQLWDTKTWSNINCFEPHAKIEKGKEITLYYDFDITWENETNYEDLSIGFIYDTGSKKLHESGTGLILSDYSVSYKVSSDRVNVTYDYGYKTKTVSVYKDNWFALEEADSDKPYEGRTFLGWYTDKTYSTKIESAYLSESTTYYAKWEYKLREDEYREQYKWNDDEGVLHYSENYGKKVFTYETRLKTRELDVAPTEDFTKGQWCVLKFEGVSDTTISNVLGQIVLNRKVNGSNVDDYYGDYAHQYTLTKDKKFTLISLLQIPYNTSLDKLDVQFGRSSVYFADKEPVISDLKAELYAYENKAAAEAQWFRTITYVDPLDRAAGSEVVLEGSKYTIRSGDHIAGVYKDAAKTIPVSGTLTATEDVTYYVDTKFAYEKNTWEENGEEVYNYGIGVTLSKLAPSLADASLTKDSVVKITFTGIPDKNYNNKLWLNLADTSNGGWIGKAFGEVDFAENSIIANEETTFVYELAIEEDLTSAAETSVWFSYSHDGFDEVLTFTKTQIEVELIPAQ